MMDSLEVIPDRNKSKIGRLWLPASRTWTLRVFGASSFWAVVGHKERNMKNEGENSVVLTETIFQDWGKINMQS